MRKILVVALALLCLGSISLAEVYVNTVADPTYVRSEPKIAKNIVKELGANGTYEWGGHIVFDERGVAFFDLFYSNYKYGWVSSLHASLWDSDEGRAYDIIYDGAKDTRVFITRDVVVRSDAGSRFAWVDELRSGSTAQFTGYKKKDSYGELWYQVKYNGINGWVPSGCAVIY